MRKRPLKMNLQLFAEQSEEKGTEGVTQEQSKKEEAQPSIDYAKIKQMLDGTLAAKEDTALKAYFKQQGLSQEEMEEAITGFKQQKAVQQPNVEELTRQATEAQAELQRVQLESVATIVAVDLGLETKAIPFLLKMVDLSNAIGQDRKINTETVKEALNKVVEAIPGLKPQQGQSTGFIQIGATGQQTEATGVNGELDKIFGINKK